MLLELDKAQYEILFAETWHHKQDLLWMSSVIEYHVYHFVDLSIFIKSIIYIVDQNESKRAYRCSVSAYWWKFGS